MSAFICDPLHISTLAAYAADHRLGRYASTLDGLDAPTLAARLYAANAASVSFRYREPAEDSFRFDPRAYTLAHTATAVAIMKSAACFRYQACEHEAWAESPECRLIELIEHEAIRHLPGYEDANWGAPVPLVVGEAPQNTIARHLRSV